MSQTKEQILTVSLRLFAKEGYEAVSVSRIAGELGITKGALYRHYKNKQDIFDCIVARMEQDDAERSEQFSMPNGSDTSEKASVGQLTAFALAQFEYWTQDSFASEFRKLLVIEQYRSERMQALYQQYIAAGPLDYVRSLFAVRGVSEPAAKALEYYSPMLLCCSLYDGGDSFETLKQRLIQHFSQYTN